jgi:hypothetical protein
VKASITTSSLGQGVEPDSDNDKNQPVFKSKPSNFGWHDIPGDVIVLLLGVLVDQVLKSEGPAKAQALRALLNFGATSISQHQYLLDFLGNNPKAPQVRAEMATYRQKEWTQQAIKLHSNREKLRADFSKSAAIMSAWVQNAAEALPPDLKELNGIQIDFKTCPWHSEMAKHVLSFQEKVVKLDAKSIGRDRFLSEVLTALQALPATCPVILNASGNDLLPEDLVKLRNFMVVQPTIHRLDLSDNPVVNTGGENAALVQLLGEPGPLTHLYLSNTGFGDATAEIIKNVLPRAELLTHLDLRDNPISESGIINIIRGTFHPSALQTAGNRFEFPVAFSLQSVRLTLNAPLSMPIRAALEDALKVFDSYGIGESFYEAKDMTNSVFAASAGVFQFVGSNLKNMNPSGSIRAISDAHQIGADRDRL